MTIVYCIDCNPLNKLPVRLSRPDTHVSGRVEVERQATLSNLK